MEIQLKNLDEVTNLRFVVQRRRLAFGTTIQLTSDASNRTDFYENFLTNGLFGYRYQRQVDLKFYAKKIPCNMVVMNGEGEFDMIKGRSVIKLNRVETSNPGESPPSTLPTPKIVLSDHLKGILKERSQGHYYDLDDDEKEVYLSV